MITPENDMRQMIGRIARDLIKSSEDDQKEFWEVGDEIAMFHTSKNHDFLYKNLPADAFFRAKVAKTFEAVAILVPFILPAMPHRQMDLRRDLTPIRKSHYEVVAKYLNYTVGETNAYLHSRRCVTDLMIYGRGVAWTGIDQKKGLVTSVWGSVKDYYKDPSARIPGEENWKGRGRTIPRFQAMAEFPQAAEIIKNLPVCAVRKSDAGSTAEDEGADCVRLFELWLTTGIHNFKGGQVLASAARKQAVDSGMDPAAALDDTPLKYVVADNGQLIDVGPWEVPLYEDDLWPCEEVVVYDTESRPIAPLENGLGYQKAIDWLVTLMMGRTRDEMRSRLAIKKQNGQGLGEKEIDRVLFGPDVEAIEIDIKGETKSIRDFIEYFQPTMEWINAGLAMLAALEQKYAEATGLYSIFYTGEGQTQDRSAAATQMKDRNSRTRIDDAREQVLNWESKKARKEAIYTQFLKNRKDMGKLFGPEAEQAYGYLSQEEQANPEYWAQKLLVAGAMPEEAMAMAELRAQQAYTVHDIFNEVGFSIEVGSQLRKDINQHIDVLAEMHNQTIASMLQSADPYERALAMDTTATYFEAIGGKQELIDQYRAQAERLRMLGEIQMQQMLAMPPMPGQAAPAQQEVAA